MIRKLLVTGAAALMAATGALFAASPAQAGSYCCGDHWEFTNESASIGTPAWGGSICFTEHNDEVRLTDEDADGYSAYVDVYTAGTWKYELKASGLGVSKYVSASDGIASHNLREGAVITFQIYLLDGDTGKTVGLAEYSWANNN